MLASITDGWFGSGTDCFLYISIEQDISSEKNWSFDNRLGNLIIIAAEGSASLRAYGDRVVVTTMLVAP